jgi:hypothetical protein
MKHPTAPAARPRRSMPIALALACSLVAGCATQDVKQVTLAGVVRGGSAQSGKLAPEVLWVQRGGAPAAAEVEMALQPGDTLQTGPDASAVISYPGGARAYLWPNTRVRIGSIFDEIGKVFVRVKGAFKVETSFVTAASEGTEYWVDVRAGEATRVAVVEGRVGVSSNTGAWPARTLGPNQQMWARQGASPEQSAIDAPEIQRETETVRLLDRLAPVKTSITPWGAALGIAVGVGIIEAITDKDDDRPRGSTTSPSGKREGGGRTTGSTGSTGSTSSTGTKGTAPPPAPAPTTPPPPVSGPSRSGSVTTSPSDIGVYRRPPPAPPPSGPVVK